MIRKKNMSDFLFKPLTKEQKKLVNAISFFLIKTGYKREGYRTSRDIVNSVKEYTRNKNKINLN